MLNSGLHIGWGIWRAIFFGVWLISSSIGLQIFVIMAWSVGAFIGGFAGSIATFFLRKDSIYVSIKIDGTQMIHRIKFI